MAASIILAFLLCATQPSVVLSHADAVAHVFICSVHAKNISNFVPTFGCPVLIGRILVSLIGLDGLCQVINSLRSMINEVSSSFFLQLVPICMSTIIAPIYITQFLLGSIFSLIQ